jgi:hypothetical protein
VPHGYPLHDETMILPAFVTGRKEPAPKPAEPARHRPEGALPASERGMLIFVAALLGVGTIAVVAVLGMGGLNPRKTNQPPPKPAPATHSSGTAAGLPGALDPSPSPSALASSKKAKASSTASTRRSASPTPTRVLAGTPNPYAYCMVNGGVAQGPSHDDPSWSCRGRKRSTDFSPDQVCDWQFGATTYAVVGTLSDPSTWRCYK